MPNVREDNRSGLALYENLGERTAAALPDPNTHVPEVAFQIVAQ